MSPPPSPPLPPSKRWHLSREEVLHAPHAHKNPFIKRGYLVHNRLADAVRDAFTGLHNETFNILTALFSLAVAVGVGWQVETAVAALPGAATAHALSVLALRAFYVCLVANASCVVFYHVVCTLPWLYHPASATDLTGIAFVGLGFVCVWGCVPGLSFLRRLATQADAGVAAWAHGPLEASWEGVSAWAAHLPRTAAFSAAAVAAGLFVCAFVACKRARLRRESPLWLLALSGVLVPIVLLDAALERTVPRSGVSVCVSPAAGALTPPDHTAAAAVLSPHSALWQIPAVLAVGMTIYAVKFPERWVSSQWPGLLDLAGNSHNIHHTLYPLTWPLFAGLAIETLAALGEGAALHHC